MCGTNQAMRAHGHVAVANCGSFPGAVHSAVSSMRNGHCAGGPASGRLPRSPLARDAVIYMGMRAARAGSRGPASGVTILPAFAGCGQPEKMPPAHWQARS